MEDYNRYDKNYPNQERGWENERKRRNYERTHANREQEKINKEIHEGYSSYGADPENPYRNDHYRNPFYDRHYGDPYPGNFSGSNYDHDNDFGINSRFKTGSSGTFTNRDFVNRSSGERNTYQGDWENNPNNLGVRSNYSYNRGGYGSNFGGEYPHYPRGNGYANRFGQASYDVERNDWAWGNPNREYSSYTGRSDDEMERRWKHDNRDWLDRTKDEVASWFGDEEAARRRRLDERGEHFGKGPKGYTRSDERIKEDINDELSFDGWLDATDISVEVNQGDVVLDGKVNDRYSKRRAEDLAESVSGVKNVENRIKIDFDAAAEAASHKSRDYYGRGFSAGTWRRRY